MLQFNAWSLKETSQVAVQFPCGKRNKVQEISVEVQEKGFSLGRKHQTVYHFHCPSAWLFRVCKPCLNH